MLNFGLELPKASSQIDWGWIEVQTRTYRCSEEAPGQVEVQCQAW